MGKILEFKNLQSFTQAEKKIPWQYLIYRNQSILLISWMQKGYSIRQYFQKLLDIDYAWTDLKIVNHEFFYNPKDLANIQKTCKNFSAQKINKLLKKGYDLGNEIISDSQKISHQKLEKLSPEKLLAIFKKYVDKILLFAVFIIFPLYPYEIPYEEKIKKYLVKKKVKNIDNTLRILIYPVKKNINYFEEKDFLSLVLEVKKKTLGPTLRLIKKNPKVCQLILNHINKYGWIQCRNYYGKEWTVGEILERIKSKIAHAEVDLLHLKNLDNKMKDDYQKIIKALNPNKDIKQTIEISKELIYQRTFRTDVYHQSGYNLRELLADIGKRLGYSFDDLIHMRYEEILNLPSKPVSRKDLNERKKGFAMIMIDGKMNWFWGKDLKTFQKELKDFRRLTKNFKEIKGITANPGKAFGVVRIIKTVEDIKKINRGDILVTPMTFPSFVPAMEKASAFVTDEGGILCHAAIVSREMNKPCVIATKIATKVLKDGDLVEVDAEHGIIRKIH